MGAAETADCRNLLNTDFLWVVICNIIGNQAQLFLRIFFKITLLSFSCEARSFSAIAFARRVSYSDGWSDSRTIISAFSPLTSISKMCDCMRCGIPLRLSEVYSHIQQD